jgi:hypothetical protein
MRFSCFTLLDAAAQGLRVEAENRLEPKLGQLADRGSEWNSTLSPFVCATFAARVKPIPFARLGVVAQFEPIGLKSQSEGPVSQAVARSGTTEWHPYRS